MATSVVFTKGNAQVKLIVWTDGTATLHSLYSKTRGRGHASAVLKSACAYADENNTTLRLRVRADEDGDLTDLQLEAFYARYGFVTDTPRFPLTMTRHPHI